jgi:hypothetical protein
MGFNTPIVAAPRRYRHRRRYGLLCLSLQSLARFAIAPAEFVEAGQRGKSGHRGGSSQRGRDAVAHLIAMRASARRTRPPRHVRRYPVLSAQRESACLPGIDAIRETRVKSLRVELWGSGVEMKNVEILGSTQRAIAQGAEALREKRARLSS